MRITSVDVVLVDDPGHSPAFRWRDGLPGSEPAHTAGWLVVTTDEGLRGYAPCRRGVILADIVDRRIRAELLGVDPLRREWLWHRMWELDRIEEFPIYVQGAVDDALWDLAGKAAGLPVHALIGTFRDRIPAYASTVTFGSVEEYLDVADQCRELGFPAIKLHAWGDARRDAKLCAALREHVGDATPLMYDGSAGFDLMDSVYLGHVLADNGYRPVDKKALAEAGNKYPVRPGQTKITSPLLGGWRAVDKKWFDPNNSIMQKIEQSLGVSTG